jgi:hypothetical protein
MPSSSPVTDLLGPDAAESSRRRDRSIHLRNNGRDRKWRRGNVEYRPSRGAELNLRHAVNDQRVSHCLKCSCRDCVSEDIERPGHRCARCYGDIARNEADIAAFTRPEHQAVRPESHRLTIAIGCPVMDTERDQGNFHRARSSASFPNSLGRSNSAVRYTFTLTSMVNVACCASAKLNLRRPEIAR